MPWFCHHTLAAMLLPEKGLSFYRSGEVQGITYSKLPLNCATPLKNPFLGANPRAANYPLRGCNAPFLVAPAIDLQRETCHNHKRYQYLTSNTFHTETYCWISQTNSNINAGCRKQYTQPMVTELLRKDDKIVI